jgi:hypothetical protein
MEKSDALAPHGRFLLYSPLPSPRAQHPPTQDPNANPKRVTSLVRQAVEYARTRLRPPVPAVLRRTPRIRIRILRRRLRPCGGAVLSHARCVGRHPAVRPCREVSYVSPIGSRARA